MSKSPRQRFLSYVRNPSTSRPVISPFLPHPEVIRETLTLLHLPVADDPVRNEIRLSQELGYEPMFMTDCSGLIFNWSTDESRSTPDKVFRIIATPKGEWTWQAPRKDIPWSDEAACPVETIHDHELLVSVCEQVGDREKEIRDYCRTWRQKVAEDGVIVLGHPHPSWLGYQINPTNIFYQWNDWQDLYIRSMDALYEASLFVMSVAIEEGVDFMSDSSYGLEMTSPELFAAMDLPYIRKFAEWTHHHDGLFWYHNCGFTSQFIREGVFNTLGADVIETIAPPPEGDNDLGESRRHIDRRICTKGNLNLRLLRDGSPAEIEKQVRKIVWDVSGYAHIFSTADGVLQGTRPENFITFVRAMRETLDL
ncbi:MAG: uroporphyrinogen decarboxylase family protein [Bacteroidota bacterium]